MHRTDQELVRDYINGDNDAFGIIVERHSQSLILSIMSAGIKDTLQAEDILQEAFIKAMDALKQGNYKESAKVKAWIQRIAYNKAMDYHRQKHRIPSQPENNDTIFVDKGSKVNTTKETQDTTIIYRIQDHEESPEEYTIKMELAKRLGESDAYFTDTLARLLNKLSPEQKTIITLRYMFGMSYKEIVEKEKIPMNTALARVRYALINLRKALNEISEEEVEALKTNAN